MTLHEAGTPEAGTPEAGTPEAGTPEARPQADLWLLDNRDLVLAELAVLRALLTGNDARPARDQVAAARDRLGEPGALDLVAAGFGLSGFERAVLLLACGPDLVGAVAGELTEHTGQPRITFGSALARLPDGHWSAVRPSAPLRAWHLVRLADPEALTNSPLLPDERILHAILGADLYEAQVEPLLEAVSQPLSPSPWLPPVYADLADDLSRCWARNRPVVLHGPQPPNLAVVAAAAGSASGRLVRRIAAADLPSSPADLSTMVTRMRRETILSGYAWYVDALEAPPDSAAVRRMLAEPWSGVTVAAGPDSAIPPTATTLRVPRLTLAQREEAVRQLLSRAGVAGGVEADADDVPTVVRVPEAAGVSQVVGRYDLTLPELEEVCADVRDGADLPAACRSSRRRRLSGLATLIEPRATWDRLVLPEHPMAQLRALAAAVRFRGQVLDRWGFAERFTRGLGTVALFSGPSGTGKTLAAEVIAADLELDLLVVDLSQVVSKYIGETEKHLARLFDAAEDGGVVLLFDEADTLFGKRSQVRDSHDRYANLEVGYLLQRVESFNGLAVLTTNARSALDPAFTRRLSTVVSFPYPDQGARVRMWSQMFPPETPTDGIDPDRLATADLAGGGIAAAALQAAYLAAADGGVVSMEHVTTAMRWELAKSGRSAPGVSAAPR